MERTIYLQHYRVCLRTDGTPRELSRDEAVITYEAVDERTREPVDLKLIPLESIDSGVREKLDEQARAAQMLRHVNIAKVYDFGREGGDFVCVSEHLPGETLAAWVAAHGPMPADAALRVAEQIVSVLSSARFHRLAYPPIQLSDIMVVPGQTPEGTWPLVKLINFGLPTLRSGAELKSEDSQTCEQESPAESLQSRESAKVAHEMRDISSEIYSLGATLYLLLTGGALSSEELQRPLKFSKFPKPLRAMLARMLHPDPNQRPRDLVVLAETIRECLQKIERRRALADKYGIPYRTTMPRQTKAPPRRFLRVALPIAALLLAAAVLAAVLLPEPIGKIISRARQTRPVGVVIGVPESSPPSAAQNAFTTTPKAFGPTIASQQGNVGAPSASQPSANATTASNRPRVSSPDLQPRTLSGPTSNVQLEPAASPASSPSDIVNSQTAVENSGQANEIPKPAATSQTTSHNGKKRVNSPLQGRAALAHAQMVGITSDGKLIYRLPSGRTRVVAPDSDEGEFAPRRHRRVFIDRDEVFAPPPRFGPDYFPDD